MTSAVNLYAEFLLNIRQVTIFATLQNDRNDESKAYITSDRKSISVTHDGKCGKIMFPSGISGKATVHFPISKGKLVSLRLEIGEDDKPSLGIGMEVANDSPWPARVLGSKTQLACRSCRGVILHPAQRTWKDLPRRDWAEMMDFWHCHKPHIDSNEGAEASNKGYAASNGPILRHGIGFVDTCHVLVPERECSGLKVELNSVTCSACGGLLGVFDANFAGVRLYKWSILVRRSELDIWEQNMVQNFVCAQLLEAIDSQAVRKFVAYTGNIKECMNGIYLWVLNPDLKYSASYLADGHPRRAMKILFQATDKPLDILDKHPTSVEELQLPQAVLEQLESDLLSSNNMLPDSAQILQEWRVGLLDRFEPLKETIPVILGRDGLESGDDDSAL